MTLYIRAVVVQVGVLVQVYFFTARRSYLQGVVGVN